MCLFHDLGEAFTGDVPSFEKTAEDEAKERGNVRAFLNGLPARYRSELNALFDEMEALDTPEAKLFKALDNMEAVIQHNEADIRTWNDCWLDFWDMLSEGIMMPLGALLMSLMIGWEIGPEFVKEETEQSGHVMGSYGFFKVCVKFITPLIMVLILYGQIKEFFF